MGFLGLNTLNVLIRISDVISSSYTHSDYVKVITTPKKTIVKKGEKFETLVYFACYNTKNICNTFVDGIKLNLDSTSGGLKFIEKCNEIGEIKHKGYVEWTIGGGLFKVPFSFEYIATK